MQWTCQVSGTQEAILTSEFLNIVVSNTTEAPTYPIPALSDYQETPQVRHKTLKEGKEVERNKFYISQR